LPNALILLIPFIGQPAPTTWQSFLPMNGLVSGILCCLAEASHNQPEVIELSPTLRDCIVPT
jgi:hypothetical protein